MAKLRVYKREENPAPALEASPTEQGEHGAVKAKRDGHAMFRLALVFGLSFALSSTVVLVTWFTRIHPDPGPQRIFITPSVEEVLVPEPAAVAPEPVEQAPEPDPEPESEAAPEVAEIDEAEPEAVQATPPPDRRAPAPRAAPLPALVVAAAPDPEPVSEPAPEPEIPVSAPLPAPALPPIPAAVQSATGFYAGKAQGAPMSMKLDFLSAGRIIGVLHERPQDTLQTVRATGTWALGEEGVITFALVEDVAMEPRVFSGQVEGEQISGRVTVAGRSKGKFNARR
jgi:hypothetical protein